MFGEDEKELVGDTDSDDDDTDMSDTSKTQTDHEFESDILKLSKYFREFDLDLVNLVNLPLDLTLGEQSLMQCLKGIKLN